MTRVFGPSGPFFSSDWNSFNGPARSSASNQPPTKRTAGLIFFMCGTSERTCQNSS